MNESQSKGKSQADEDLEREIRANRKFSLSEAIGRMAGPGAMKGESPVARQQQAVAEVDEFIRRHLTDSGGVLADILIRAVTNSQPFLNGFEHPRQALLVCLQAALESEYRLKELVREADVEWGRVFGERPYFEKEGKPPDPNDPYTWASVRAALSELVTKLNSDPA